METFFNSAIIDWKFYVAVHDLHSNRSKFQLFITFTAVISSYTFQEEKQMTYKTKGVCSSAIDFELDEEKKLHNVTFRGGCSGNTQGIAKLVEGMDAQEVIRRLDGIRCGMRPTSCPDQLSKALKEALQ